MMFEIGEEYVTTPGLGLIKGKVQLFPKFNKNNVKVKLPHIGWNTINPKDNYENSEKIFQYFVHSYAVEAKKFPNTKVLFTSNYADKEFIAAIRFKNTVGFQFHPERSGFEGLNILSKTINELLNSYKED